MWPFVGLLLPLPLLVWWLVPRVKGYLSLHASDALRVPFFRQISGVSRTIRPDSVTGFLLFLGMAWICLIFAGMRPVKYEENLPLPQEARNIMLTIDFSTSMSREDFDWMGRAASRIDTVKAVVRDFIAKRTGDRLGLVVFGSEAYTLAPLSQDLKTLDELFTDVGLGVAGDQTAIGDALALAVQDTAKVPTGKKVIILLSDGSNNAGKISIQQATELAKAQKIAVYTIGIGAAPRNKNNFFGLLEEESSYNWDERSLKRIASETGGRYFRANSTQGLTDIYKKIDQLETTTVSGQFIRPRRELFYYPLLVALGFWILAQKRRVKK